MEAFARRLYERHRQHYLLWVVAVAVAFLMLGVALPAVLMLGGLLAELERGEVIVLAALAEAIAVGSSITGIALRWRSMRPLNAWLAGSRTDPVGAWDTAERAPIALSTPGVVLQLPILLLVLTWYLERVADLSWVGLVGVAIGITLVVLAGYVVVATGFHSLFRPALEEISQDLPGPRSTSSTGWSVRLRMVLGASAIAVATGGFTGAAVTRFDSVDSRIVATMVTTCVISAYVVLIYRIGFVGTVLRPLTDLAEGTRRVADGEFTERVPMTSADEFGDLVVAFNEMQDGLRERASLQAAFGSYVDPALAERVLAQGDSLFEGEDVEVTVFFLDVRDFTALSERISPQDVVKILNRLFGLVVPVLREHGGHANSYIGDSVLAVFGVPEAHDDHADRALAAAAESQRRVRREFGEELRVGIGISTGIAVAGTMGGGGKLEFTVIGDPVNVAARVEKLTKATGDGILLTQATVDALQRRPSALEARGEFVLEGKRQPVQLYAIEAGHFISG